MKIFALICTYMFLIFCVVSFAGGQQVQVAHQGPLVQIGKETISIEEFKDLLKDYRRGKDTRKMLDTLTSEGRAQILDEFIDVHLFGYYAREMHLDKDPAIKRSIEMAVITLLAQSLINREIKNLDLDESNLQKYYNLHQKDFMTERRIKARQINTRTKEEIEAALSEIKKGGSFADVAAQKNIDATKSRGGDLGWIKRGIMVKPFEDALFSLKPGQMSGIVETEFGYHLIKVEEIDEGEVKPFESVKKEVKQKIIEAHIFKLKEKIKTKYPVSINKTMLEKINKN